MRLKLITPPVTEPVSVGEVRTYLRLDCDEEELLLGQLIKAARQYCEDYQHRAYMKQTLEVVDVPNGKIMELPRTENLQNILLVSGASDYTMQQDLLARLKFTVDIKENITVRYVTGVDNVSDVDEQVKLAIKMLVAHWFENRTAVMVSSAIPREVPLAVTSLLAPGRIITL